MQRRLLTAVVVALVCNLTGIGWVVSPVAAAGPCDDVVTDDAGMFGDDQSQVEVAAGELADLGVDVRVYTRDGLAGNANIDALMADLESQCDSWLGPDGIRKSNLLVFLMAITGTNPDTGNPSGEISIFYGNAYEDAFTGSNSETRILADHMVAQFPDFEAGFVAGMDEAARVIDNYLHPGDNSGPQVVEEATDYSGLWRVLGFTVGALILIGGGVAVYFAFRRKREAEEERQTARTEARRLRDAASTILNKVGDPTRAAVRTAKVTKYSQVGSVKAEELRAAGAEVDANYTAATDGMAAAAAGGKGADNDELVTAEYSSLAVRYEEVLVSARAAEAADELIDAIAAEVDANLASLSQDALTAQAGLDQLKASVASLKGEGIRVDDIDGLLSTVETELAAVKGHETELTALSNLANAQASLGEANEKLDALRVQREQLANGIPALEARIAEVVRTGESALECFERISAAYAESSWESVEGNGTEAENRVDEANDLLAIAKEQSSLENQQWAEALASILEGNLLLDKAMSLLHSIIELERNLESAKAQAPREIDAAQADIDKAAEYIDRYDDDIREEVERDLDQARVHLDAARNELSQTLPDYLRVMELATTANSAADRVYNDCVEEHEAAERLRRQAATTLAQAEAAISKAAEYIEDHDSDVGSTAEDLLNSAKRALAQAQQSEEAKTVLKHATTAFEDAQSAYKRAKADFNNAEEERERARARRRAAQARRDDSFSSSSFSWGSSRSSSSRIGGSHRSSGGGSSISFSGGSRSRGGGSSMKF